LLLTSEDDYEDYESESNIIIIMLISKAITMMFGKDEKYMNDERNLTL